MIIVTIEGPRPMLDVILRTVKYDYAKLTISKTIWIGHGIKEVKQSTFLVLFFEAKKVDELKEQLEQLCPRPYCRISWYVDRGPPIT